MMYSVLYRDSNPTVPTRTLVETDRRDQAVAVLEIVVLTDGAELIDFSPNLDGALDYLLAYGHVQETYEPVAV